MKNEYNLLIYKDLNAFFMQNLKVFKKRLKIV